MKAPLFNLEDWNPIKLKWNQHSWRPREIDQINLKIYKICTQSQCRPRTTAWSVLCKSTYNVKQQWVTVQETDKNMAIDWIDKPINWSKIMKMECLKETKNHEHVKSIQVLTVLYTVKEHKHKEGDPWKLLIWSQKTKINIYSYIKTVDINYNKTSQCWKCENNNLFHNEMEFNHWHIKVYFPLL